MRRWSRLALSPQVIDEFAHEIREAIEGQIPTRAADVGELEAQLRAVKAEQRRLTKAVALADDVPELVTELRQRCAGRLGNPGVGCQVLRR